jgi:uncharacterized GH25 family protein
MNPTLRHLAPLFGWLALACPAAAHDFWIQPDAFRIDPKTPTSLTLQVGHGKERRRSPIRRDRITRFVAVGPQGAAVDLLPSLHLGEAGSDGDLRLADAGVYVLALQTDSRGESHLPADRFNDYLRTEGVTPAIEARARTGRTGVEGSECYSRIAKAIVQAGRGGEARQDAVTRPLGLPLEIVPELDPYKPGWTSLPVRVFYEGRPLAGALVKLTELTRDEAPLQTQLTDAQGRARFSMPQKGAWLLNVVWTKPLPASSSTDFETVFSSLSFGFPDADH